MKRILSFFCLILLGLPCFSVEVSTYNQLRNAINTNQENVELSADISFGSTSLTAHKNINLTTVNGSTFTISGNTVSPMITFEGASSTISNITFSSTTQNTSVNPAVFINVGAAGTGQTYSTFTIENVSFTNNISNTNAGKGGALNINSQQGTYLNNVFFSTNSALGTGAQGGAIYYEGSGDFIGEKLIFSTNTVTEDGGAIYASTANILTSIFSSNTANSGNGGAVYLSSGTIQTSIFLNNTALVGNGGAVYASTLTLNGSVFSSNTTTAGNGGAIYITDFVSMTNASFSSNTAPANNGGAVYNLGTAKIDSSTFKNNNANNGGAIYNMGTISLSSTTLEGNESVLNGGAIYTKGDIKIANTKFSSNTAGGNGGAVFVDNSTLDLNGNTNFINNISGGSGGAIYVSSGTINLNTNENIIFKGNTDSSGYNDITLDENSSLNISGGGTISFYGGVTGGTINSNNTVLNWYTENTHNGTLNMTGGSLNAKVGNPTFGTMTLNGTTLNMQNDSIGSLTSASLTLVGDNPLYIDVDLANNTADTVSGASGNFSINNYTQLNILSDSSTDPTFTVAPGATVNINTDEYFYGPLYVYKLQSSAGGFQTIRTNRVNPTISVLPIAANSKVISAVNTVSSLFNRIDIMFSRDRLNYRRIENPQTFGPTSEVNPENPIKKGVLPTQSKNHMAWFIPNGGYQKVNHDNGIEDVKNYYYGGLVGIDFPFLISDNTLLVPTVFMGYLGTKQKYQETTLHNDSLALGLMATLKNYFALLSAQMYITNGPESYSFKTYSGSFDVFSYTASVKGELDLNLSENIVVQPAVTALYNLSNLQNYTTANGASINSTKFHNILLSPSLKIMGSYNGWYPYLSGSYNFNTLQKGKVTANDLTLLKHKVKSFAEFSVGLENTFLKDYSGYIQFSAYAGNASGISFQIGLRGYID